MLSLYFNFGNENETLLGQRDHYSVYCCIIYILYPGKSAIPRTPWSPKPCQQWPSRWARYGPKAKIRMAWSLSRDLGILSISICTRNGIHLVCKSSPYLRIVGKTAFFPITIFQADQKYINFTWFKLLCEKLKQKNTYAKEQFELLWLYISCLFCLGATLYCARAVLCSANGAVQY